MYSMYSVEINIDSAGWTGVTVDKISPFTINVESGQQFKRVKWGEISISNSPFTNGELFQDILNVSYLATIEIKATLGDFTTTGYFSKNDCSFDYNRRIVRVTPTTLDEYTRFLETYETEIDFNDYVFYSNPITVNIPFRETISINDWTYNLQYGTALIKESSEWVYNGEFDAYFNTEGHPNLSSISDLYLGFTSPGGLFTLDQRITIMLEKDYILSSVTINESKTIMFWLTKKRYLHCLTEFSREEFIKEDVSDGSGGFEPPIGTGWNIREAVSYNGKASHLWTRTPLGLNAQYFIDNLLWTRGDIKTLNSTTPQVVYRSQTTSINFSDDSIISTIDAPMTFKEMLNYYYRNTHTDFSDKEVISTFFFNDNEGSVSLLNGRSGANYVTLNKNNLNNIVAFNTNDIVILEEGNENKTANFSLKSILDDLGVLFDVFWLIDSQGNLRIEHIKYLDITKNSIVIDNTNLMSYIENWEFDKSGMYSEIIFNQTNAKNGNFTDNKITYPSIVTNTRGKQNKTTYSTSVLSTDIEYAVLNPGDVQDGIMLAIIDENRVIVNSNGYIDNITQANGELALSKLLNFYHRYEGIWEVGEINGVTTEFLNVPRTKTSGEFTVKGIKNNMFFTTLLGIGVLDSGTIDLETQITKLKLSYRYNSTPESDTFALMAEQSLDFYEAESIIIDLGIAGSVVSYIVSTPEYYSFSDTIESKAFYITGVDGLSWTATIDQSWVSIVYPQLEFPTLGNFPLIGQIGYLYKATDTGIYYLWVNSLYEVVIPTELSYISGFGDGVVNLSVIANPDVSYRYATLNISTSDSEKDVNLVQRFVYPATYFDILSFYVSDVHLYGGVTGTISYSIKNLGAAATRTITRTTKDYYSGAVISTVTTDITLGYLETYNYNSIGGGMPGIYTMILDTGDETETRTFTVYLT